MDNFLQRLKQHKLVQWAIAYVAGAWVVLQVLDLVSGEFGWPGMVMRGVTVAMGIGFFVALVLAWYHGERGAQRAGGIELLMLAALLVIAAVALSWVRRSRDHKTVQVAIVHAPVAAPSVATSIAGSIESPGKTLADVIPAKSVAVLPFENLSVDKGNAYFADGMQDLILTKLADIGDLKVISRTSTMKYASHPDDLKTIGKQLGVATLLEGSVQKAGKQVLINVQLIDARTDSHIWAQSYTRTLDNIFGVEGEVAQKVADELKAKLSPAESQRVAKIPTTNTAAYDAYLKGVYYTSAGNSSTPPDANIKHAISSYRQAVALDPDFALAWADLSRALLMRRHFFGDTGTDLSRRAKIALDHALALQPDLEATRLAQGMYRMYVRSDLAGAQQSFAAAHALKPQDAWPLFMSGLVSEDRGDYEGAIQTFRQASVLNPRTLAPLLEMAGVQKSMRRYAAATRTLSRASAVAPDSVGPVALAAETYSLMGDLDGMHAVLAAAPDAVRASYPFQLERGRYLVYRRDYAAASQVYQTMASNAAMQGWQVECGFGDVEWNAGHHEAARQHYQRCADMIQTSLKRGYHPGVALGDLGWPHARLGRADDALKLGEQGIKQATYFGRGAALWKQAKIQAQVGRTDGAVANLKHLLAMPAGQQVSVPLLRIDPTWDTIRHDPRFQALLKEYDRRQAAALRAVPHA